MIVGHSGWRVETCRKCLRRWQIKIGNSTDFRARHMHRQILGVNDADATSADHAQTELR